MYTLSKQNILFFDVESLFHTKMGEELPLGVMDVVEEALRKLLVVSQKLQNCIKQIEKVRGPPGERPTKKEKQQDDSKSKLDTLKEKREKLKRELESQIESLSVRLDDLTCLKRMIPSRSIEWLVDVTNNFAKDSIAKIVYCYEKRGEKGTRTWKQGRRQEHSGMFHYLCF